MGIPKSPVKCGVYVIRTKEKGWRGSKGRNAIHGEMKKRKCLVNTCLLGHSETMAPRGLWPNRPC